NPISFILFTPPRSNRLTSSGYDSKILERLFTIFRDKISNNYNQNQSLATLVTFSPCAVMTDADIKDQCCKNEINKQLGHDGENKTILLRQTLKAFLKSVLNEARLIDGSEEIVRNYITKKKRLLECIYKAESLLENKKVLEGGLNFLSYLKKQWAGDLLSSWCLNGRMNAAKALEIPLEKLPIMNNHLEGMN
ncbi:19341_t:CDS:2, partial [Gigaspora rosea]